MEEKECFSCSCETSNFYSMDTNNGKIFKCKECYELEFMRDHRNEYNSAYQNTDMSTKVNQRF